MKMRPTRRQFVSGILAGAAAGCAGASRARLIEPGGPGSTSNTTPGSGAPTARKSATDQVVLGATGIKVSRLALGSGTHGWGGRSDQTSLGVPGFAGLLVHGFDQGLTFFETADQYGAHPHVREAMRQVGRKNVVVLTKTHAETAAEMRADLDRFRAELGTETIDIVLLHNKQSATWTTECARAMDVLSAAKESGTAERFPQIFSLRSVASRPSAYTMKTSFAECAVRSSSRDIDAPGVAPVLTRISGEKEAPLLVVARA